MSDTTTRLHTTQRVPSKRAAGKHQQLVHHRKVGRVVMSGCVVLTGLALLSTSIVPMLGNGFQDTMMPGYSVSLTAAEQEWDPKADTKQKAQPIVRDDWTVTETGKATKTTKGTTSGGSNAYFSQFSPKGATEREKNAAIIIAVGRKRGFSWHSVTLAVAVGIQESNLYNGACCDHRSHGIFQQQWGMGWGTLEQTLDPIHASNAFYNVLGSIKDRDSRPMIEVAMQVQRPNRYAYTSTWYKWNREGAAASIVRDYIRNHA